MHKPPRRPDRPAPRAEPARPSRPPGASASQRPGKPVPVPVQPLDESEIQALQQLLDAVPAPLEALDVTMLDGYLCGVLLQPRPVPAIRWLPFITDTEGRPLPARFDATRLHTLAQRRHVELAQAIAEREWFDPWVFAFEADHDEDAEDRGDDRPDDADDADNSLASEAVYPWVAGFATAMEHFPAVMALGDDVLTGPLALLYRHLDPDDLEDADALLAEIESLVPPNDLSEAIEELVRATLLLADLSRPVEDEFRKGPGGGGGAGPAKKASRPAAKRGGAPGPSGGGRPRR